MPGGGAALPELALSGDGLSVAVVNELGGGLRHVNVVGEQLGATQVTATAGDYDTPHGGDPLGPLLALSDDGTLVAFRGTTLAAELFVRPVAAGSPVQVTADAHFTDTIDNVGILGFTLGNVLIFVAGEQGATQPAELGGADLFTAQLGAGGALTLSNVTQTSGLADPPFLVKGELEVLDALTDPLGERLLLVTDPDGADAALLALPADGSGPGVTLLPSLLAAPDLAAAGANVLVSAQPADGNGATLLHLLNPSGAPLPLQLLGIAPPGIVLDRQTADHAGLAAALVAGAGPGLELPVGILLGGPLALPLWPGVIGVAPLLAFTSGGGLAAGVGAPAGPFLFVAFDGPYSGSVLSVPVGAGFPLAH